MGKPVPPPRGRYDDFCPECGEDTDTSVMQVLPNNDLYCRCGQCGAEWVQ